VKPIWIRWSLGSLNITSMILSMFVY
jgi:hypothetical protein